MGFGQHQSFYLRDGWLYKGLEVVDFDPNLLSRNDAFEKMGIGKNMLAALRFWLIATGLTTYDVSTKDFTITEIGREIYQNDSNLNLPFTRGLVHYNLAKNSEVKDLNGRRSSAVIYWFFNILEGNIFEKNSLIAKFGEYVAKYQDISPNSLKRDIDVLLQMYDMDNNYDDPEDVLHSPLSELGLVSREGIITKLNGKASRITEELVYYILVDYLLEHELTSLTLNDIASSEKLLGKVFNMKREEILKVIFQLQKKGILEFSQTNNLDMITMKQMPATAAEIVAEYYKEKVGS